MKDREWKGNPESWNVAKNRPRMDRLFKLSELQSAAYRRHEQRCSIWLVQGHIQAALRKAYAATADRRRYAATSKAISEAYEKEKAER